MVIFPNGLLLRIAVLVELELRLLMLKLLGLRGNELYLAPTLGLYAMPAGNGLFCSPLILLLYMLESDCWDVLLLLRIARLFVDSAGDDAGDDAGRRIDFGP